MRRNAFTLIELLAVIVILAIIALIAVPIVINIISESKEESAKRSVQNYLDTSIKKITSENLKTNYNPDKCIIQGNSNIICYKDDNELLTSSGTPELVIDIKGNKPTGGTILLKDGKIIDAMDIYLDNVYYNYENGNIVISQLPQAAGLYDEKYNLVVTWDELVNTYGFDISSDYNDSGENEEYHINNPNSKCWFNIEKNDKLKKGRILIISKKITKIGKMVFAYSKNLTTIKFEKNSKLKNIQEYIIFASNVEDITIPKSIETIGKNVFSTSSLSNIIFEETSQLKTIGVGAFSNTALKSITIPKSVETIGESAFSANLLKLKNLLGILKSVKFEKGSRLKNI